MRKVTFEAGRTVFSEGDKSNNTYMIVAGSVDIVIKGRDGENKKITELGPGEVFGEMGIMDSAPRSATAVTRGETTCLAYTADEVVDLLVNDPAQAMALIRSLILRLRNANQKIATLTTRTDS